MQRDYELMELTGAEKIEDLEEWFSDQDYDFILAEVNRCWPQEENNEAFARELFERFGKPD